MWDTWEIYTLIIGFIIGFFLYTKFKFRGGGVIVVPILSVYFVKFPSLIPYMILISIITFFILEILYSKFIIYGRRLMYVSLFIGMILSLTLVFKFGDIGWYGFLIPGLLAYNFHREKNSTTKYWLSLSTNIIFFMFLVIVSFTSIFFI